MPISCSSVLRQCILLFFLPIAMYFYFLVREKHCFYQFLKLYALRSLYAGSEKANDFFSSTSFCSLTFIHEDSATFTWHIMSLRDQYIGFERTYCLHKRLESKLFFVCLKSEHIKESCVRILLTSHSPGHDEQFVHCGWLHIYSTLSCQ